MIHYSWNKVGHVIEYFNTTTLSMSITFLLKKCIFELLKAELLQLEPFR